MPQLGDVSPWPEGPRVPPGSGSCPGYLEAGGDGGVLVVGCLWIPNQVVPAGEHLEAEYEVITVALTRGALRVAGHSVGCTALLLHLLSFMLRQPKGTSASDGLGPRQQISNEGNEPCRDMGQDRFDPGHLPPKFRVPSKHTCQLPKKPAGYRTLNYDFYAGIWCPVAWLACECFRTLHSHEEHPFLISFLG